MIVFKGVYDQYKPGDKAKLEPTLMRRLVGIGLADWYVEPKPEPEEKPAPKKETATSKRAADRKKATK